MITWETWLPIFASLLLLLAAYIVFRKIVRSDYLTRGRLTRVSSLLQLLIFILYFCLPYLFNPFDWAQFWYFGSSPAWNDYLGLILIILGFLVAFGTMIWFGLRRAFGRETGDLIQTGPYHWSRNPQIVGGYLLVIGSAIQQLYLFALGWVILWVLIAHMMIVTEEEYLHLQFGGTFDRFCTHVPRYLRLRKRIPLSLPQSVIINSIHERNGRSTMIEVSIINNSLQFGNALGLTFHRTLRIPDDGETYPLPPSLGRFPILPVSDYADRVPAAWAESGGFIIPMYQREALWISFSSRHWKPNAVKIAIGEVNAVSGSPWARELHEEDEDYLVCPPQPWLDGINAGEGFIRQFVAMPLGMGYTVEAQVTGEEKHGGVQIYVYEPKPGIFPDEPPYREDFSRDGVLYSMASPPTATKSAEMGLAAGGKMKQKIYPDPHGLETWDQENYGRARVHIINSAMYKEITGQEPPPSPISAELYTKYGFPWFDLYDEEMPDIEAPEDLKKVKSVNEIDQEADLKDQQADTPIDVPEEQIIKYKFKK